ncbi:hypothetical protein AQUSIP_12690 [Aquicella siphonis]|uniref:Antitoxin Xre/MbcA/ParS-like toxin-binding domain-containing protein n=1 Tax=Aquicella siphonis TaxID=254247 RepID=A0A5E4PHH0_9COXI|nr:hypothetical protein AQUSIP_12690 [Aquicella siphonis]
MTATNKRGISYAKVYSYALEMFQYDKDKTNCWWMSKLPEFGNKSPYEMVKEGRSKEIVKLITRATNVYTR